LELTLESLESGSDLLNNYCDLSHSVFIGLPKTENSTQWAAVLYKSLKIACALQMGTTNVWEWVVMLGDANLSVAIPYSTSTLCILQNVEYHHFVFTFLYF
jgi:hypothetical protein